MCTTFTKCAVKTRDTAKAMESDRVKAIDSTFTAKDKDLHKAEAKELSQSPSENVSAGLKEKNTTRRYSVPSYHVN